MAMSSPESSPILDAALNPNARPPVLFQNLVSDTSDFLRKIKVPNSDNVQFYLDGILFQVSHHIGPDNKKRLTIWSVLGYLPFSVVSQQKRRILIDLLNCLRDLATVKFGIDKQNRIIVTATYEADETDLVTFFFTPILLFLQSSLPYIKLIGEAL